MNEEKCVSKRCFIGGNPSKKIRRHLFEASIEYARHMTNRDTGWFIYEYIVRIPLSLLEQFEQYGVVPQELENADGYPLLVRVHDCSTGEIHEYLRSSLRK